MFTRKREPTLLENAMEKALRELDGYSIGSGDYTKTLDQVIKLHKMIEDEKSSAVSKDTLAIVAANLLGIVMIIQHEHLHPITSRAMNLVIKPR